ncbi:MAG: ABC-F family ATP-binding cassette domain-containing protein [Armatimonadetes bacterium]|nr:ABC-F family ATP-binding cassette domain-containing protein [Anaerolineae bacterium]
MNKPRSVIVGYLPQEISLPAGVTLLTAAMQPPPKLAAVEARLSAIEARLGEPDVYNDSAKLTAVLAEQEMVIAEYTALGGAGHPARVRDMLHRLGFTPDDYDLPTESLSGGQKKLAALVVLAVGAPEVLLLDEPDNHLDFKAKRHLEAFIHSYPGAVLIVSHDRYLLDESVTHIAELEDGALTLYPGNYTAYAEQRELKRLRQQQMYVAQQKTIQRIEARIHEWELMAKADLNERYARQARSRRKMLDRMEANGEVIERVRDRKLMAMQLEGSRGSDLALRALDITMGFGDELLMLGVSLVVQHGERVGLIGENGAGKSVLFKLLLGELSPLEGTVIIGNSTRVGYYSQEHQTLAAWLHRTPVEAVRDVRPMSEGEGVHQLLKFAFTYEQARQPISTLSGGERSRLQLLRLMLTKPNLLLLDEPTNNLDIASLEVLEEALEDFEGAVLTISHDRYFLDRIADRVVALQDGALTEYSGGYSAYMARKAHPVPNKAQAKDSRKR